MPRESVIVRHDPCPWLPVGSRAEVVVVSAESGVPCPTPVVRLLVTAGREILVVPRTDGLGPDLPTSAVVDDVESTLQKLHHNVVDGGMPRLIGFVRNTVPDAPADYPWPVPVAHFAVWQCEAQRGDERCGEWLSGAQAQHYLGARHWWPLVRAVLFDATS